jgi:putative membrane protein
MHAAANIAVGIVALIHVYILVLEMFLWEKPAGLRAFGLSKNFATVTRVLAGNQGLYNGFLAAGLFWGLGTGDTHVQYFFLGCILVAGMYGAFTASIRILWVQAVPAAVALILVGLSQVFYK